MSGLSVGQRAERVLQLLMGLRNGRVASKLAAYGFTDKVRHQGWQLLEALTENRLDKLPSASANPALLSDLDAWENKWFPIANVSLAVHYPAAHQFLFNNLHQTDGLDVLISVGTFLRRLDELPGRKDVKDAGAARKLLGERGLTDATLAVAKELLDRAGHVAKEPPPPAVTPEQAQAAEKALWDWYLEWSTIARTAISNRRLLRELGFLRSASASADAASADATDAPLDVAPVAPPVPVPPAQPAVTTAPGAAPGNSG